eukprot:1124747-Pelagomonas_calceolata.AAC.1
MLARYEFLWAERCASSLHFLNSPMADYAGALDDRRKGFSSCVTHIHKHKYTHASAQHTHTHTHPRNTHTHTHTQRTGEGPISMQPARLSAPCDALAAPTPPPLLESLWVFLVLLFQPHAMPAASKGNAELQVQQDYRERGVMRAKGALQVHQDP